MVVCLALQQAPVEGLQLARGQRLPQQLVPIVPADAVGNEGAERLFRIPVPADGPPLVYAKPVRRRAGGGVDWSMGSNYLLVAGRQSIYPYFDEGMAGCLTEQQELGGRTVRVFLPPGYAENTEKRYPTLYILDGANVFLPQEAFSGVDWGVDETMTQSTPSTSSTRSSSSRSTACPRSARASTRSRATTRSGSSSLGPSCRQ